MTGDIITIGQAIDAGVQVTKELREFLLTLVGPVGKEMGEIMADKVRFLRFKNSLRTFERAKQLLAEHEIEPHQVNIKILIPVLEGASLEEDDNLVEKWAGLLASASANEPFHPSFPQLLNELSPLDAQILDIAFDNAQKRGRDRSITVDDLVKILEKSQTDIYLSTENLMRLRLMTPHMHYANPPEGEYQNIWMTKLGFELLTACAGPKGIVPKTAG